MPPVVPPDTFAPDTLGGLKVWFDATDLTVADGEKVASWPNKAALGTRDAVQATPANQPIFETNSALSAKPAVRLDKDSFLMLEDSADMSLNDMTVFAVISADNLEGNTDNNQIFSKLGSTGPWDHSL